MNDNGRERQSAENVFMYDSSIDFKSHADYSSIFKYKHDYGSYEPLLKATDAPLEPASSRWIRHTICLFFYLLLVLTFPVAAMFCLKKIPSLERLVIFRLGKLQKVKGPGWAIVFPIIDRPIKVDLQPANFSIPTQQLLTCDGGILEAGASGIRVEYRVCDIVKSVLRVKELELTFQSLALRCLVNSVSGMDQEDVEKKTHLLEANLRNLLNESTVSWGLEVTTVNIPQFRVLKAAEPQTGMSQIVSAFQSALGLGNSSTPSQNQIPNLISLAAEDGIDAVVDRIRKALLHQTPPHPKDAALRFQIEDIERFILCTSAGDSWQVLEESGPTARADVTVTLPQDILLGIVSGKLSAIQAFATGQIRIEGDTHVLIDFMNILAASNSSPNL